MNINEVFRRLNAGIAECKDGIAHESDRGRQIHLDGIKTGLEAALKVINEVNFDPPSETGRNKCLGYGDRKGRCGEPVPKKFLQLYCDTCNNDRLSKSNRPVYKGREMTDEVMIIPFKVD